MRSETNDLMSMIDSLPIDKKTSLVDRILKSLHPLEKKVDDLWLEESERRVESLRSGNVQVIPGDEVFKALKKRNE